MRILTGIVLLLGIIGNGCGKVLASPGEVDFPGAYAADAAKTWQLKTDDVKVPTLLHTKDGGRHWTNVAPAALVAIMKQNPDPIYWGDLCDLSPLDSRRAWLAVEPKDKVMLEYTSSGGRRWSESIGPNAIDGVSISFLNDLQGFVMTCSAPACGSHEEKVYYTGDGARHWETRSSPDADGLGFYVTGISFRTPLEGWITATYHGPPDVPLFHTQDGGKTWSVQALDVPVDYRGGYANTYPPAFFGRNKKEGRLPVRLVRHTPAPDHYAEVYYETYDGGATWRLPKSGVHSMPLH